MTGAELILSAIEAAADQGPELVPDALLAVTAKHDSPLNTMADWDAGNEMFAAVGELVSFVNIVRATGSPPGQDDFNRLAALLRWLIREFAVWASADDPKRVRLAALLVVARSVELDARYWEMALDDPRPSKELLEALRQMISGTVYAFTTRGLQAPIWETEAIDRLANADAAGDWEGIAVGWQLIEQSFFPSMALSQSVQCLCRFDFDRLVHAVADLHQVGAAMAVVRSLHAPDALRLADQTENAYVQFAAVYEIGTGRRNDPPLSEADRELLAEVLIKVSREPARWAAWMKVFNRIPTWFSAVQPALGRSLAATDDAASQAYWDALNLYWLDKHAPGPVAECMRAFTAIASAERRRKVWEQAYARWTAWRFDAADPNTHLTQIGLSALDYAIVGYAVENLSEEERQNRLRRITDQLVSCGDEWYADLPDCLSEWNRLLSEFQPFAHAANVARSGGDWLAKDGQYLPFDPQTEPYVALKFRLSRTLMRQD